MNDFRDLDPVEFEIARRGYDRDQVDAHLGELRAELRKLHAQLADPSELPGDGSYPEPIQEELDRVSTEVESIVAAARQAAEGLRTRAAAEASRWRDEADADARRWRSEAEVESARVRDEAAADSQRLLDDAERDVAKQRADADAYAARVREEADAYAQQTREVAEAAAAQVKEEADAYAAQVRRAADEESAEVRESADTYSARVTGSADSYAEQTRREADADAESARTAAREDAAQWRGDAEAEASRMRAEADTYATEVRSAAAADAERLVAEADSAAADARTSAHDYADGVRSSADADTAQQREEARSAAEAMRASVWDEATAILDQVAREVADVRERAENEALAIIADGEQQSHRMVSQARQTSEEQRRAARIEAERLVGDAQAQHDEIIENATRAAATAQERTQALERRRTELMGQLEKAQQAMRTLEEELETRQENLRDRNVPLDSSTVKIVQSEPEELAGVRVIPSAPRTKAPPVTAEEIMDEVRSLREQRLAPGEAAEADDTGEPEPVPEAVEEAPPPADEPVAAEADRDIDALFANLREVGPAEAATAATSPRRPAGDVDPDDLRERLLLPLQNTAHRQIKRQLTEQQNLALEQLRISGESWEPALEDHQAAFASVLSELVLESTRAGYLAARELGVRAGGPPELPPAADAHTEFAADLVAAVTDTLVRSRTAGESTRKTSGAVSRVYRSWRTDGAEHRLRELSEVAYADALRTALRDEGMTDTEWALGEWAAARHAS
ncbi:MAG: hypothetical protein HKN74_09030 [Acidimicrobiia bacterium]|nr:DivIVA domain-containing protein [Acidimicrobiia bacterium]NNF10412.1 hypothetical protein [Acidimicrobiia bacterium]